MWWQGGFDLGLSCCATGVFGKTRPYNRTPVKTRHGAALHSELLPSVRTAFPLGNTPELLNF
jgi:hypothetical protein